MGDLMLFFLSISSVLILSWVVRMLLWIWWKPKNLEKYLMEHGITGPPYRLLYGNLKEMATMMNDARSKPMSLSHDIVPRVAPFLHQTMKNHGKMSVTWFGPSPRVSIMDSELIREILSNKSGDFVKIRANPFLNFLIKGLVYHEGEKWANHRRILNPAFHIEKLKLMLPEFYNCCIELISKWENFVASNGSLEFDVWPEFQNFTGDVISRTAFGSNFEEGRKIFQLQTEQAKLVIESIQTVYLPGYRFLPTKKNIRMKEIEREERALLRGIINKRVKAMETGDACKNDLLGLLLESNLKYFQGHGNSNDYEMTIEEVIDECQIFYLAGQETTSVLLTWTMVVLGMHPNWQVRAREEVLQVFGKNKPDFDGLNHLKIVTMILYEVLRLYPPAFQLNRSVNKNIKLGEFSLPPGVQVTMPITAVHHDPELWGEDADEFNPERFSRGISNATKNQVAFFPFSWGPRICIGQNFTLIEAKMALAMILQHFAFELSPSYAHAPYTVLTLQPQYGAQIILHRLS